MPKFLSARPVRRVTLIGFTLFWFIALAGQSLCAGQQPFASLHIDIDRKGKAESRFGLFLRAPLLTSQTQVLSYVLGMEIKLWQETAYDDGDELGDEGASQSAPSKTGQSLPPATIPVYVYEGESKLSLTHSGLRLSHDIKLEPLMAELHAIGIQQLRVFVAHPHTMYSECSTETTAFPFNETGMDYHLYELSTDAPQLSLLHIGYGYSNLYVLRETLPLVGLLLLPIILALRTRRLLLQWQTTDPARAVVTAARLTNALTLLLPVAWILALFWTDAARLIELWLNLHRPWIVAAFYFGLFILPPVMIMIGCRAILKPALAHIRDQYRAQEFVRDARLSLANSVTAD